MSQIQNGPTPALFQIRPADYSHRLLERLTAGEGGVTVAMQRSHVPIEADKKLAEIEGELQGIVGKRLSDADRPLEQRLTRSIIEIPGWNEDVERGAVKKWAIANGDFNPLWLDEKYAKQTKWGGLLAPPMFLQSVEKGFGPSLGYVTSRHDIHALGINAFNSGGEWEFFHPVRVGDRISTESWIEQVYTKIGRMGKTVWFITKTIYQNQKGEVVAEQRNFCGLTYTSKEWSQQEGV